MNDVAPAQRTGWLRSVGPAIITASVVLGPGSILSASRIGYQFGNSMNWILVFAVLMMIGITALSARLGVVLEHTLCSELAIRAGRPAALITGISLFLIAACFQFGNNLGVIAALEPMLVSEEAATEEPAAEPPASASNGGESPPAKSDWTRWLPIGVIVLLNVLIVVALFGFRRLYLPIERLMKLLVTLMIIGFAGNLIMARPDLLSVLAGLLPQLPEGAAETLLPTRTATGEILDNLTPVTALFATTFSIGGAFYQSYLVRKKGWTVDQLGQGLVDSTIGILVLGMVTAMVLVTAATVLHNNPAISEPKSAADVVLQLEPLFGPFAKLLFCLGIFAGAFSSFLVNAMIGGTVLSDGLGWGGDIDERGPRICTVLALLTGMVVAIFVLGTGNSPVNLIIFAQAVTVLGLPALALALVYLSWQPDLRGERRVPLWLRSVALLAVVVVAFLAARTAVMIWYKL